MKLNKIFITVMGSLLLFFNCLGFTAFAETSLPPGAVKGLPERLAALDDAGNSVNSATGEYFYHVEGMEFGKVYSKKIQLINLQQSSTYKLYFYVEPLFKNGEIDLEKGVECKFYLDGNEFYSGTVNGDGNIDLKEPYYLGSYAPGASHILTCTTVWHDTTIDRHIDNGRRLYDTEGEHILDSGEGNRHAEGEIEFKWIFCAEQVEGPDLDVPTERETPNNTMPPDKTENPQQQGNPSPGDTTPAGETGETPPTDDFTPPYTGMILNNGAIWIACMCVIAIMIVVLLVLIKKQQKKKGSNK